jgi:hypothetical protein
MVLQVEACKNHITSQRGSHRPGAGLSARGHGVLSAIPRLRRVRPRVVRPIHEGEPPTRPRPKQTTETGRVCMSVCVCCVAPQRGGLSPSDQGTSHLTVVDAQVRRWAVKRWRLVGWLAAVGGWRGGLYSDKRRLACHRSRLFVPFRLMPFIHQSMQSCNHATAPLAQGNAVSMTTTVNTVFGSMLVSRCAAIRQLPARLPAVLVPLLAHELEPIRLNLRTTIDTSSYLKAHDNSRPVPASSRLSRSSTGILWNNQMDDFSRPDTPNKYNLTPSGGLELAGVCVCACILVVCVAVWACVLRRAVRRAVCSLRPVPPPIPNTLPPSTRSRQLHRPGKAAAVVHGPLHAAGATAGCGCGLCTVVD